MLELIANFANGDARTAPEHVGDGGAQRRHRCPTDSTVVAHGERWSSVSSKKSLLYDKHGEEHYNLISALHKSMRNSDPDAAVYWLARMLEAAEDPLYVARRLVRFASEDVGLADSRALEICGGRLSGLPLYRVCRSVRVHLTHAAVYLSPAPKSNALYTAYETAKKGRSGAAGRAGAAGASATRPHGLMKELHYGEGYQYAHDSTGQAHRYAVSAGCLCRAGTTTVPTEQGSEARVAERLAQIEAWRAAHRKPREKE